METTGSIRSDSDGDEAPMEHGGLLRSYYPADLVLRHFDQATSLATVFLIVKLGWEHAVAILDTPLPMLMAMLCFFHIMVYWINFHHVNKFSETKHFSIGQTWVIVLFVLGFIFYPISLEAWIETDNPILYAAVNCFNCALLNIWVAILPSSGGDRIFCLYRRIAPPVALLWYVVVLTILSQGGNALWMIWVAPFFFAVPLGAAAARQPAAS